MSGDGVLCLDGRGSRSVARQSDGFASQGSGWMDLLQNGSINIFAVTFMHSSVIRNGDLRVDTICCFLNLSNDRAPRSTKKVNTER
uniref:Uncharacterized protein n=1 Tax=Oryza rufipogon TaxID=4529 RepID=A0A0E0QTX9_ORYRU